MCFPRRCPAPKRRDLSPKATGTGRALRAVHHSADPDVLVLDEPTDGLDPNQKFEVRQLIRRMGEESDYFLDAYF